MTEPGSIQSSWSVEEQGCLEWADPKGDAEKSSVRQLKLDLGELLPQNHHEVDEVDEIENLRSLVHKQKERIHHLEQALDQSLISLEELRFQLINQEFLENQLASTEEIANIQQRAITQLKQQLAQQEQALETQETQRQEQTYSFQLLLETVENLAEGQQNRLAQLKLHLHRAQNLPGSSLQSSNADPATGSFVVQPDIQHLTQQINSYQTTIQNLETELHHAHIALQEQQAVIASLQNASTSKQTQSSKGFLDNELFAAHCKIQDLETQISKQITTQAILQHTCEELEQARDRYCTRATELERQAAEMQEQILKQAQQASEYETAVQHWKDRYTKSQNFLLRLKFLVEQTVPSLTTELADMLATIQAISETPEPEHPTIPSPSSAKMDIPDFLARRNRYRVRS
ncbi:hypothetical protein OsccyDRAFT_0882 [Leptolyngbyaceae cyanobacterium JSC-12]|nr:hypothetical protein OsccyDRAFT_0882 [Leptolyngbyaceae cyanobacterium JSC-12]